MILEILTYTHNITTMLFGIFLSAFFLGVKKDRTNVGKLLLLAVISGGLYMVCVSVLGPEMVDQIYPLIVHVPLLLMLVLYYKFRILPSLISIFTAYLCCQCSNWMGLFVLSVTGKEWCYYACRIVVTLVVFWVLCRYVCQTTAMLLTKTNRELLLIGSLPLVYFREYEMKSKAEQYNELIRMQMNSFQAEMDNTRKSEKKMSILRHDTRHHMAVLRTLIQQGDCEKALEYLNEVSQTYDDTVIKAYCRNEMVNSVLSTYNTRFEEQKIPWEAQVTIGEKLPCSEMMFCAILSNVLENAMHAVQELPERRRRIELSLSEKAGHLLLMVKNPVQIMPVFTDGIPVTERSGHGLGVRSIVYYVEKLNGQYQFRMEDEEFVVRLIF